VLAQLLAELDGLEPLVNVTVMAATNRPDILVCGVLLRFRLKPLWFNESIELHVQDKALVRPGRFDRMLYVGPPNRSARLAILKINSRKMKCAPDVDFEIIADEVSNVSLFFLLKTK
jgi:ATP-dependent 26S proteasome regulatory subunit